MKKTLIIISILILTLILILIIPKDNRDDDIDNNNDDNKPQIAASFNVLKFIIEDIAGEDFNVISIIPSGVEPHGYEPLPKDQLTINDSSAVFYIGLGFDDWISELVDPDIPVFDLSQTTPNIDASDPHYWLSYTHARYIADTLALELKSINPSASSNIDENLNSFKQRLDTDRNDALEMINELTSKAIITEHDAYRYFASDLGLDIVANIEPQAEGEMTPMHVQTLLNAIEQHSIKTIFMEKGSSSDLLDILVKDHGLRISYLDSEGILSNNYLDMMKLNIHNIIKEAQ